MILLMFGLFPLAASANCVVMLHGLARSDSSFLVMQETLERQGYQVENAGFASTSVEIEHLSGATIDPAVEKCGDQSVHFVTHSMGAILLRHWTQLNPEFEIDTSVMLGPPNHGSEIVDKLGALPPFRWVNGPSGLQLKTGVAGLPNRLGPVNFSVGVIAGSRSLNPVFSVLIPGRDDGKVSIVSTHVSGMADHIVLPVTHTFIMNNPIVIAQTLAFLQNGQFDQKLTYGAAIKRLALTD